MNYLLQTRPMKNTALLLYGVIWAVLSRTVADGLPYGLWHFCMNRCKGNPKCGFCGAMAYNGCVYEM